MATVRRLNLLPRVLLAVFAVSAIAFGLVLAISPVQALSLVPTCVPSPVAEGDNVTCTLHVGLTAGELVPIDTYDLIVKNGGATTVLQMRFSLKGDLISQTVTPPVAPAITGKPTINPAFGYGYGRVNGARTVNYQSFGYNFGAGFGYGPITSGAKVQNLFTDMDYAIQINTAGFAAGLYSAQFILNTGATPATFVATTVNFTVAAASPQNCLPGYTGENCNKQVIVPGQTAAEVLKQVANLVPADAAAIIEKLDPAKRAAVMRGLPVDKLAHVAKNMKTDKLAEVFKEMDDDSSKLLEAMAKNSDSTGKAAAALSLLAKTDPQKAANVISKVDVKSQAKVALEMTPATAGSMLSSMNLKKRDLLFESITTNSNGVNPDITLKQSVAGSIASNAFRAIVPELTPEATKESSKTLLKVVDKKVPANQLSGDTTPESTGTVIENKISEKVTIFTSTPSQPVVSTTPGILPRPFTPPAPVPPAPPEQSAPAETPRDNTAPADTTLGDPRSRARRTRRPELELWCFLKPSRPTTLAQKTSVHFGEKRN